MNEVLIRRAQDRDLEEINELLFQVLEVHATKRPDIFKIGTKKYTDEELRDIFRNPQLPVFVAVADDKVVGYCFCVFEENEETENMHAMKTLYIDDLCVDHKCRGKKVGSQLYEHVVAFAKENNCYRVTLNVWALNESAYHFYQKMGLLPLKTTMEKIL